LKIKYGMNEVIENQNIKDKQENNFRTIYGSDYSFVYHYKLNCENNLTVIPYTAISEFGLPPCQKCTK